MRNMSLFIARFLRAGAGLSIVVLPQLRVSLVLEFMTRSHELTCLLFPLEGLLRE
jgi:hypothetical protein